MGQYFRVVNYDKKEFLDPWAIGGGAKLWEWCANHQAGAIPFLIRKSTESGGGDIKKDYQTAGRWAGDRIALVGDYDHSGDFHKAETNFRPIHDELRRDYNDFIVLDDFKLFRP